MVLIDGSKLFVGSRSLIILILILLTGFVFSWSKYWTLDDDNLVIFLTGRAIVSADSIEAKLDEVVEVLKSGRFESRGIESIEVRKLNLRTYLLPSTLYALTSDLVDSTGLAPRHGNYGVHLVVSSILGYWLPFLLAAGLTVFGIVKAPARLRSEATVALGVLLIALVGLESPGHFEISDGWLGRLPHAIVNPGVAFGLFGMAARCNVVLLAFSIFIMRASGRFSLSYVVLLIAVLFHRQQGALLMSILVATDLFFRPRQLVQPRILACLAPTIVYFAAMETFWPQIGVSRTLGLTVVVGGLAAGVTAAILLRRSSRDGTNGIPSPDQAPGPISLRRFARDDRTVYSAVWLLALVVSDFAVAAELGGNWFWRLLPGRLLMVLQPLLVLSLVQFAFRALSTAQPGRITSHRAIHLALVLGFAGLCIVVAGSLDDLVDRAGRTVNRVGWVEAVISLGVTPRVSYRDESNIYYAILSAVDSGSDLFDQMIAGTRSPGFAAAIVREDHDLFDLLLERGEGLDRPVDMVAPKDWPRPLVTITPFLAAVLWDRRSMVRELRARLGDDLEGANLSTVCEAISRGLSRKILELIALADTVVLSRSCPPTPGIEPRPPVCLLVNAGELHLAQTLVEAGVSSAPPGGCDDRGRGVRAITLEWEQRRPKNAKSLLRTLDALEN